VYRNRIAGTFVLLALLMPAIVFASGGTETTGAKVSLRYATRMVGTDPLGTVLQEVLTKFEAEYPNVEMRIEETPGVDQIEKIKLDVMSNNTPDLFDYWRPGDNDKAMPQYLARGALADLTAFSKDPHFNGMFPDHAWRTASVDGKVRGIPYSSFFVYFSYNKTIFDKYGIAAPDTWANLEAAVAKLKANGVIPWAVSLKDNSLERLWHHILNREVGNERALRMYEGKEKVNVPETVRAFTYLRTLTKDAFPEDASALDGTAVYQKYLNTEKAAMQIWGSWTIRTWLPEVADRQYCLPLPLTPTAFEKKPSMEQDVTALMYAGADGYGDAAKKPYIEAFIKAFCSRETAKQIAEVGKQPIPFLGVDIDPDATGLLFQRGQKAASEAAGASWLFSKTSGPAREATRVMLAEFYLGKLTPEQAAKKLDELMMNQ
jgi:ABC-type glycerol-3-phosphate transport system substrate-binding protein